METKKEISVDEEKSHDKREDHEKKDSPKEKSKDKCCKNRDFHFGFAFGLLATSIIVAIIIFGLIPYSENQKKENNIKKVTAQVENFINDILMAPDQKVKIISAATEEGILYKTIVDPGNGEEVDTYITGDNKLFFLQAINIKEERDKKANSDGGNGNPEADNQPIAKNDKPVVELFVMSHCPYGTQMEKGFLPVINTLGDKIDFQIKFVDYAMHGKTEVDEQLNQYCIQKEENEKYVDYLKCFLDKGEGDDCIKSVKINSTKLSNCVETTDKEFKITEQFDDRSTWTSGKYPPFNIHKEENTKYGVQGSPSLVINGVKVSSARDPKSILSIVCSGFENQPEECIEDLPSVPGSTGFGFDEKGNATDASCG